jgi:hypothetical protein
VIVHTAEPIHFKGVAAIIVNGVVIGRRSDYDIDAFSNVLR